MPFSPRPSIAAVALGVLVDALVIALGFVVPLGDPLRNSVDNSLFMLGTCGVLITLFAPRSRLLSDGPGTRAGLALYGLLSLTAVLLVDFSPWRRTGWLIKAAAGGLAALSMRGLLRET